MTIDEPDTQPPAIGRPVHPEALDERLLQRIRAEYRERPELRLTAQQATRLWNLDASTCGQLLDALVGAGYLRTVGPHYLRAH